MAGSPIRDVSDTAFMVATYRAMESERPDALFSDPLARRVAGEEGRRIVNSFGRATSMGVWSLAIRTVIIDDYILVAIARGTTTILNLGAGLDTRPYRMKLPESIRWIEVDYPHMIEHKESRLAGEKPRCQLERVKLDLADRPARQQLFAEINKSADDVLVLTEGVVLYLNPEDVGTLADDIRAQEHFQAWIVDYFSSEMLRHRRRQAISRRMENAPFKFAPKDWGGFFQQHGWSLKEMRYLYEEGERLRRPIQLPPFVKIVMRVRRVFMSARRRGAMRQFAGYAVLVPG